MRYSMLVHLTKMVRTLQEAAAYIDNAPDGDSLCTELLSNGVEMLEQIRMTVDQHRGDLYDPILLEHLAAAEALWEVGGDTLQGALEAFALALPKSVRYQVRAVFFTGLGSTWDAMQSVYEYMRDDPRFDPVVVLIPVFRRVQQGGQVKQEVTYVDYLTPMGIPFLEYTQYSLEKDSPDIAFTNQPYESVIPSEFWPETIAKYTRLVYLPYFTPALIARTTLEGLCQLPVYCVAWKVIGLSKAHYRYYRKHSLNGGSNMLVTGLPKLDPTIHMKNQEMVIPEKWRAAIQNRKVFLWNTWYDYNWSMLQYFNEVVQWFQTHDDCALIWRPHPMTDSVTKLYYPSKVYAELQRNIAVVKKASNMIFDDEVSYEPAFACSDALISAYSSLMVQYLLLDKPVLWTIKDMNTFHSMMNSKDTIVSGDWMEVAGNAEGVFQFLERIQKGIDKNKYLRQSILRRDLPLADGYCGKRVCESLWTQMHEEDLSISG